MREKGEVDAFRSPKWWKLCDRLPSVTWAPGISSRQYQLIDKYYLQHTKRKTLSCASSCVLCVFFNFFMQLFASTHWINNYAWWGHFSYIWMQISDCCFLKQAQTYNSQFVPKWGGPLLSRQVSESGTLTHERSCSCCFFTRMHGLPYPLLCKVFKW